METLLTITILLTTVASSITALSMPATIFVTTPTSSTTAISIATPSSTTTVISPRNTAPGMVVFTTTVAISTDPYLIAEQWVENAGS